MGAVLRQPEQFSLAGAQPKDRSTFSSANGGAFPSGPRYQPRIFLKTAQQVNGMVTRRTSTSSLRLARARGPDRFPTPAFKHFADETAIVVERYEPWCEAMGDGRRIHQEDMWPGSRPSSHTQVRERLEGQGARHDCGTVEAAVEQSRKKMCSRLWMQTSSIGSSPGTDAHAKELCSAAGRRWCGTTRALLTIWQAFCRTRRLTYRKVKVGHENRRRIPAENI